MDIETDAQRTFMLQALGVTVRIGDYTYTGIHDSPYTNPHLVAGRLHSLLMLAADVTESGLANGGTLTVDGTDYTAREPEPDGLGWSRINLAQT